MDFKKLFDKHYMFYILLMALSIFIFIEALSFPTRAGALGPGAFPKGIALVLFLFSAIIFFRKKDTRETEYNNVKDIIFVMALVIILTIVLKYLYVAICIFGFLFIYISYFETFKLIKKLLITVCGTGIIMIPIILLNIPI